MSGKSTAQQQAYARFISTLFVYHVADIVTKSEESNDTDIAAAPPLNVANHVTTAKPMMYQPKAKPQHNKMHHPKQPSNNWSCKKR